MLTTLFITLATLASTYFVCPEAEPARPNTWIAWRNDVKLSDKPDEATLRICCDSKYWLWVNGKMVVFEGCLKRGPNRTDSYYDEIDLKPWLRSGRNRIAVLQWYFGKSGFSHNDSGKATMWLESDVIPSEGWSCRVLPAYKDTGKPLPNYRLPESNIRFDERENIGSWQTADSLEGFVKPVKLDGEPLGGLRPRPIPQWRDFGIREAAWEVRKGENADTLYAKLPYNMQITPIIEVSDAEGGRCIRLETDHAFHGLTDNIRAEYITAPGTHVYESYGWMNGERLLAIVPHGAKLTRLCYRQTGYDLDFSGRFSCNDLYYMDFWHKAQVTLYVNMRDNFFDCPDRERAQWWGDLVTLQGEAFYTTSRSVDALIEKAIRQLCEYQRPDSTIFSPIPGNYDSELPAQMLSAIGRYGIWTYYMNTGDRKTLEFAYPYVKKYLGIWKLDETGLTAYRKGGWPWGDWGKNIDLRLILAAWHYMALESAANTADLLGFKKDALEYRATMEKVKAAFNSCWTGTAYRHPDYRQLTDDRAQALAVVAGIAPREWWPQIVSTLKTTEHASPYLEKYVMEALFVMGEGEYAMERTRKRFATMVNDPERTSLFEGWELGSAEFGGGTSNHAWSGGAQTVIAQELCGIRPVKAGWTVFEIAPKPVCFEWCRISVPTVKGMVSSNWKADGSSWTVTVPEGSKAIIRNPWTGKTFTKGPGTWKLQ